MTHIALARKYRPKKFADIIGQSIATTVLNNIITHNKIHHAYLLTGTRGVGKTTIARIIAKALNCENIQLSTNNTYEPCGTCSSCTLIDKGSMIDVIEIDAASNTGIDNIREVIENSQYAPTDSKYKVYIIDEVHMLSKSAFNAMLKTLEEPPAHIIFILATTELHKIPITVLSRCLQIKLRNLTPNEIANHLHFVLDNEKIPHDEQSLNLIAKFAKGSMRDALSILDQAIAFSNGNIDYKQVNKMLGNTTDKVTYNLLNHIINHNGNELINLCQSIYQEGYDLEASLQNLLQLLQDICIMQITNNQTNPDISHYSNTIHINTVQLYFEICNLGISQIKQVEDKYSTFLMTLLRMLTFKIGTVTDKKTLLTNTNNEEDKNNTETRITPEKIIANNEKHDTNHKLIATKEQPLKTFDGDWITLVKELKTKLTHSTPFLDNSELVEFNNYSLHIKIDARYKSSFNQHAFNELNDALINYFNTEITLTYVFYDNVNNTFKEHEAAKKKQLQQEAIESINLDANLINITRLFSATILPDSIKPLI